MRTGTTHDISNKLESTRRRFERWRLTHHRSRIPESLWASAVKAAIRYGLHPTARMLRLDYYSLKRRVKAAGSGSEPDRRKEAKPVAGAMSRGEFIELAPVASACSPECILELERPDGVKMRMRLAGMSSPDWAALSRSFWGMET
jgi:hypothetical protein